MSKIFRTAASLQKKDNIPQVSIHLSLIKEVQTDQYWSSINVKKLDSLRTALRDLIKYLDTQKQEPIYTHFEDELDYDGIVVRGHVNTSYESLQSYKDRVESYIRKNKDHLTIHKLRKNIPITKEELNAIENMLFTESVAGTKEQFVQQYGEKPLGAFIRSVTGLEQSVLNEAFADFLQVGDLRADQMTFINTIISYLSKNGTIDKNMLYQPPFTDLNDQGIDGVFDNDADLIKIIKIIDLVNDNAMIA
jgi:type I restriction enzyme R subunit